MRIHWASHRKFVIWAMIIFIFITQCPTVAAQDDPESQLLNEISQDWPTDMIEIYIETPNKWDPTYGNDYNITNINVLNEMSAIEEAMDPQKDDLGEDDEVFSVQSISELIKEIFLSQRSVVEAFSDELEIPIPTEQIPGDYAIPQDQEEIDDIVSQIPEETKEIFARDTNSDGVWDTAVIWLAVTIHSTGVENEINFIIDKYYVDPQADGGDYNSGESWWERIRDGEVYSRMTSLGYTTSYETYHGPAQTLDGSLPFIIVVILLLLTLFLILLSKSWKDTFQGEGKGKNSLKTALILMIILIALCSPFVFINTSSSPSPKLEQYSDELGGGQMGVVLIRGNPAPLMKDEPTQGGGSMKDIEVLDDMEDMQEQLRGVAWVSPYCVIDIMKMIRIPEAVASESMAQMPDPIQAQLNQTISLSFWDAIHLADDDETSTWGWYYGKSQQDSMINIFYNSITIEMRRTFVNQDFSRSLMYMSIPMEDSEDSSTLLRTINGVVSNYPAGQSTSNVVLIGEQGLTLQGLTWMLEVMFLFVIMTIGVIVFALSFHKIRKKGKDDDEDVQPFIPDYEIGIKGGFSEGYDVSHDYPDYREPPPY